MGQNFSTLEYGNCRDLTHAPMPMQFFIYQFREKNPVHPIEKCLFLVLARKLLIIHFLLHYLSSGRLGEVKNKGKFQTFSSKSGRGRL